MRARDRPARVSSATSAASASPSATCAAIRPAAHSAGANEVEREPASAHHQRGAHREGRPDEHGASAGVVTSG